MCVHVGTWDNPEDAMGMAHFVEHMLFLGTKEYPEEGAFQRFVVQNGGDYNAFTASDSTCYLFSMSLQLILKVSIDSPASLNTPSSLSPAPKEN